MSRTGRLLVLASLAASALAVGACSLLIEDFPLRIADQDASTPDASMDATVVADASAGCQIVRPPPKPVTMDMSLGATYIVAINGFTLPSAPIGGFDLDQACTCDSRDQSPRHGALTCKPPTGSAPTGPCDLDGGVDNALAKQVARVSAQTFTDTFARANEKIYCGNGTVVIAINGYNGLPDDDEVIITLLSSSGIWDPHDGGDPDNGPSDSGTGALFIDAGADAAPINCGTWVNGAFPYPAHLDGTDKWSSPPGSTVVTNGQKLPGVPFLTAYVANYRLVIDMSRTSDAGVGFVLSNEIALTFHSPIMTATIVPLDSTGNPTDGGSIAAIKLDNGLIAGRCNTHELLSAFAPIPLGGGGVTCQNAQQWSIIYIGVCTAADITDDPSTDFAATPGPCSALSTAFAFTATPATIGRDHDSVIMVDASLCTEEMTHCP